MPTLKIQGHDGIVNRIDNPNESLSVVNLVWDAIGLDWAKQTQEALGVAPTEYTEDAVGAADPVGTIPLFVRRDTPGALVSLDGDNVGQRGTNYGAIYVTPLDSNGNPALSAPHVGLISAPWNLVHEAVQYTTTQTSTFLVVGGASEKIVVTRVQIQAFGTTEFDLQLYFGTAAFVRGTNRACFDGTFKPSSTFAPGVVLDGPFIAGTNGDDLMVTTSANGSVTINVWYYVVT